MTSRSVSRVIWWIIIAFGLVVGAVLLLLGYYLFGVIIGGFAVLRLIYTLSLPNRRGPMWSPPVSDSWNVPCCGHWLEMSFSLLRARWG